MIKHHSRVVAVILVLLVLCIPAQSAIIYVATTGNDANTGLSWDQAKKTVQAGINSASSTTNDEVWVSAGTYYEHNITLKDSVPLYGGFSGTETSRDQRDWKANASVLDGQQTILGVVRSPSAPQYPKTSMTLYLDGFTIQNGGISSSVGGGIYFSVSGFPVYATIRNNTIKNCLGTRGAGVYCSSGKYMQSTGAASIENNTFTGNGNDSSAVQATGCAIYCTGLSPTITDNTITGNAKNHATGTASACVYLTSCLTVAITDNSITDNGTTFSNVIVGSAGADSFITAGGGGIFCSATDITVSGNTLTNDGTFGINCSAPKLTVKNNVITGNVGVGATCGSDSLEITGNQISFNVLGLVAGGSGRVLNNVIRGNRYIIGADLSQSDGSTWDPGGIRCSAGTQTVANNLIIGNGPGKASGIWCTKSASPIITNNTIVANDFGFGLDYSGYLRQGAAISCDTNSSPTIVNNIIASCTAGIMKDNTCSPVIKHNCFSNNWKGNFIGLSDLIGVDGNFVADPKLADLDFGNAHIQPGSPCIDAGDDMVIGAGWQDIDGNLRTEGSHVDIGADESDATVWEKGPYAIIRVSTDGNDSNDGSSWSTSKKNIQAAIDAATKVGGQVWVKAGDYQGSHNYPKGIHVVGGAGFSLKPFVQLFGGFQGNETDLAQRDYSSNITSLVNLDSDSYIVQAEGYCNSIDGFRFVSNGSCSAADTCISGRTSVANCTLANLFSEGLSFKYCIATVKGNTLSNISLHGVKADQSAVTIESNTISAGWDAVMCSNCPGSTITGNTLTGIAYYGINHTNYTIGAALSTIRDNRIIDCGSCGINGNNSATISNNLVANCGKGIYWENPWYVTGNTVVNNAYNGIEVHYPGCVANNIVAFNKGWAIYPGDYDYHANCLFGNANDNPRPDLPYVNVLADPLFVDRANGNYHLAAGSPCIDAGDITIPNMPLFDIDHEGRICGRSVDIGVDEAWSPTPSPTDFKRAADSAVANTRGAIVSAAFPGFFYIESADRSSGIRVEKANHGFSAGMTADVSGTIATSTNGERCIAATTAVENGEGSVAPLGLNNKSVGGSKLGLQDGLFEWKLVKNDDSTWRKELLQSSGMNNIGLLVRVWGRVTQIDPDGAYFYIDDGSKTEDGTKTAFSANYGVRILADGRSYQPGEFKLITGVSSCFKADDGKLRRLIRAVTIE